jgi:hypothetical protein
MGGVSCVPLLPVNLVSFRGYRDVMINALFQNTMFYSLVESNPSVD